MASCVVISSVITVIDVSIKIFEPEDIERLNNILINARSLFIYFAAASLVGLLAELRIRLKKVEFKTMENFCNRLEARSSIIQKIKEAAFLNKEEILKIRVYGRRLTQNINSISEALNQIEADRKKRRNIELYLYYSNAEFLQSLKPFNTDRNFAYLIETQIEKASRNIKKFREEIEYTNKYNFLKVHYRKHFDLPQFWAIQIDDKDIFWGYFTLQEKEGEEVFEGSLNNCFHFDNRNMELDGFSDWVNNNFNRLEKWSKKES